MCLASRDWPRWQQIPPPLAGTPPALAPRELPVRLAPRPDPTPSPAPSSRPPPTPDTLTVLGEDVEAGVCGTPRRVPPAARGPGCAAAPDPARLRLLEPGSLPDAAHLLPHPAARVLPRPRADPCSHSSSAPASELLAPLRPLQPKPRSPGPESPAAPHEDSLQPPPRCLPATHRLSFSLPIRRLRTPAAAAIFKPPSTGRAWDRASPAPSRQAPPLLGGRSSWWPHPAPRPAGWKLGPTAPPPKLSGALGCFAMLGVREPAGADDRPRPTPHANSLGGV